MTPPVAPNIRPTALKQSSDCVDIGPDRVGVRAGPRALGEHAVASSGKVPNQEQTAELLVAERDAVLREMPRTSEWSGAAPDAIAEGVDSAIAQLWSRSFKNADHIKAALRSAAKLRGLAHWRNVRERQPEDAAGGHTELDALGATPDFTDDAAETADLQALLPYAQDCLAELSELQADVLKLYRGHGVSRAQTAAQLGISASDVQKAVDQAEHTIAMFAVVVQAGRLCAKRSTSITAYLQGTPTTDDVRRAQAHLESCAACHAAYMGTKRRFAHQVASLVPLPLALAGAHVGALSKLASLFGGRPAGGGGRLDAVRETAFGIFSRQPNAAEAAAGAGLGGAGIAVGAKLAIGACAVAIAGGGAVCSSIGVLPDGLNIADHTSHSARDEHKRTAERPSTRASLTPVLPAAPIAPTAAPASTTPNARAAATRPSTRSSSSTTTKAAPAPDLHPGSSGGGGFENGSSSSSTATPAPSPAATSASAPASKAPSSSSSTSAAPAAGGFDGSGFENGTP
jgi:DNA-directed RNA polymerase specialized sigma24 family protein